MNNIGQVKISDLLADIAQWGDLYYRMALLKSGDIWTLHTMVIDHRWPKDFTPPFLSIEPRAFDYGKFAFVQGRTDGSTIACWLKHPEEDFSATGKYYFFKLPNAPQEMISPMKCRSHANYAFSDLPWGCTFYLIPLSPEKGLYINNDGPLVSQDCEPFRDLKSAFFHYLYDGVGANSSVDPLQAPQIIIRDAHPAWIAKVEKISSSTIAVTVDGVNGNWVLQVGNKSDLKTEKIMQAGTKTFDFDPKVPTQFSVYLLAKNEWIDFYEYVAVQNHKKDSIKKADRISVSDEASPDFSILTSDKSMHHILEDRWIEAQKCMKAGAPLAAVVMMGGLLEGALCAAAHSNIESANRANASPKANGKAKPFDEWSLNDFINVAHECKWIRTHIKSFSHELRDYRNLIHPWHQRKNKDMTPNQDTVKISWEVVRTAINELLDSQMSNRESKSEVESIVRR